MEMNSQQSLPVSTQNVWEALNDIDLLKRSIPGCESIAPSGENRFDVLVTAAIGPVKAKFRSKLQLLDMNPPESYTMQFDGQGGPAGFGKGTAKVRLESVPDGTTVLHYAVTAQVGGKIAQVGSRLIDMAAQKMAQQFFDEFERVLIEKYAPQVAAEAAAAREPAAQGLWARFVAALRRMFGLRQSDPLDR